MVLNSADELLVTGEFWTSINFGGPTHEGAGTIDAFLAAFATD